MASMASQPSLPQTNQVTDIEEMFLKANIWFHQEGNLGHLYFCKPSSWPVPKQIIFQSLFPVLFFFSNLRSSASCMIFYRKMVFLPSLPLPKSFRRHSHA